MKIKIIFFFSCFVCYGFYTQYAPNIWGFFGHRKINRMAVFTLPPELIVFYKKHVEYVAAHATDPDNRRYASPHEAVRHYMDLDKYGTLPFNNVPRNFLDALLKHATIHIIGAEADTFLLRSHTLPDTLLEDTPILCNSLIFKEKDTVVMLSDFRNFFFNNVLEQYYEDAWPIDCDSIATLLGLTSEEINCETAFAVDHFSEHGILPYHLARMQRQLTDAFVEKDAAKILRLSADFGHYIGDAHVPLHTTENYNGQLTGQDGIHAFWESRLPELFAEDSYDFWVGKAEYIADPQAYFWNIVLESHALVDSVLNIEKNLRQSFPADQQFCFEQRGNSTVRTQCQDFSEAYHLSLNGMVENRFRGAILAVGSAWYTAWWDAGQPVFEDLKFFDLQKEDAVSQDSLAKQKKRLGIFGRKHE